MTTKKNVQRQSIARNSIYTVVSQVIVNVVGIFVVGYIAKSWGTWITESMFLPLPSCKRSPP